MADIIPRHLWSVTPMPVLLAQPGTKVEFELSLAGYQDAFKWALEQYDEDLRLGHWFSGDGIATFILRTSGQAMLLKLTWAGT